MHAVEPSHKWRHGLSIWRRNGSRSRSNYGSRCRGNNPPLILQLILQMAESLGRVTVPVDLLGSLVEDCAVEFWG